MSREPARNLAASVRARLLTLAQEKGEDYQRILGKYAVERFLFRLGRSEHRDRFILKGAMLFTLWMGEMHRPTKDLDLLGWGSSALEEVDKTVREICAVEEDDGLAFDGASVAGEGIKEDDEYEGVRVKLSATLAGARIPMQIDIGFGDAVYPEPEFASFPTLLSMEAPRGLHLFASQSHYPNIFAPYENIDRFSWRRFFGVTDRDSDLLDYK
jgi:hypothetical protein